MKNHFKQLFVKFKVNFLNNGLNSGIPDSRKIVENDNDQVESAIQYIADFLKIVIPETIKRKISRRITNLKVPYKVK